MVAVRASRDRTEFEKGGETLVVDVNGPLVLDDADLMIRVATDGLGLTFSSGHGRRRRPRRRLIMIAEMGVRLRTPSELT